MSFLGSQPTALLHLSKGLDQALVTEELFRSGQMRVARILVHRLQPSPLLPIFETY